MSEVMAEVWPLPNRKIVLVHGDLTEAKVDGIDNAANAKLMHAGGVSEAIVRRGGISIQGESTAWVRKYGPITPDKPAITNAGELPCQFVIHNAGPEWGEGDEDAKLHSAVHHALLLASSRQFENLALPAISTGIFCFPKERGARIILEAILEFLYENPRTSLKEVQIVLIDQPSVEIFAREFNQRWPGNGSS